MASSKVQELYQVLEHRFALWNKVDERGMVACSSGTAALHLAMEVARAVGKRKATQAIIPDLTMIACARAAALAELEPVFVDCREDLLINPHLVAVSDLSRVAAIMAVHIYGRACDMESLAEARGDAKALIVEDLAEAHGLLPHKSTDVACWSFYKNKIVAGEEGGAVWFRKRDHADLARSLRCLGFDGGHTFYHQPRGHNYRMSNCHAELILTSFNHVERNFEKRLMIQQWYDELIPAPWRMLPRVSPWVYDVRIKGMDYNSQAGVVKELNKQGIQARCCFKPMSLQPEFRRPVAISIAREISQEIFYLPIIPDMDRDLVADIVLKTKKAVNH